MLILNEARDVGAFMTLLMKRRNTGVPLTGDEKKRLRGYLLHLSLYVPILIILLLPGGQFLIPVLAELLDRRRRRRSQSESGNA